MNEKISKQRTVIKIRHGLISEINDEIAVEFALTIIVNGDEFATVVCTPSELEDLIIGLMASEGVVRSHTHIKSIQINVQKGLAYVELYEKNTISIEQLSKRFLSSCCGKSRLFYFPNDMRTAKTIMHRTRWTLEQCYRLMTQLQAESDHFKATGGVHNAAICSQTEVLCTRMDVGRHNTLDKLYGWWMQSPFPLQDKCIVFSGRISSEVLLKTAKIGIGLLISKSAPTDLALDLAEELGVTTIGFLRGEQCNVYTHPERIADLNQADA
jgi:FdhD protein